MFHRVDQVLHGAWRTLREEGLLTFSRRVAGWLRGARRYHGRPPVKPSTEAESPAAEFARLTAIATQGPLPHPPRLRPPAPLISVLIRTQNRPGLLRNALHSLAMQECGDFEAVVVNDGGVDVTALLHEFEPYFPIQYVRHEQPKLLSASSNTALALMRGQWFVHLDDDDIVYPQHVAVFAQAIAQTPDARAVYSNHVRVLLREDGGRLRALEYLPMRLWPFDAEALLYSNFIAINAMLIHRGLVDAIGGYDETLPRLADWEYLIRVSRRATFLPLLNVTGEYRFYVELAESQMNNREPALQAMKRIHARYPSSEPQALAGRAEHLAALEAQIASMRQWREAVAAGRMTQEQANFAILRAVAGFTTEHSA